MVERRRSSMSRPSLHDQLELAIEREQELIVDNNSLRIQLSTAQRDLWELRHLRTEYNNFLNQHQRCHNLRAQLEAQINETKRVDDKLEEEKERSERSAEKIRQLKRASSESYREKYYEKSQEVELLRTRIADRDELIRLSETRLDEKTRIIQHLKNYLRQRGFYVE